MPDKGSSEGRLDPMDIVNPVSAYFFLSHDAQDEITGTGKKRMKCLSCGQRFTGEMSDSHPERFSPDTEEAADEKDDETDEVKLAISRCYLRITPY